MTAEPHVVAYVRTSRATDWRRIAVEHRMESGEPLLVYRSDSPTYFHRDVRPKATLWVIESHPGRPPSLIARLDVVGRLRTTRDKVILEQEGEVGDAPTMLRRYTWEKEGEPPTRSGTSWYAVGGRSSRFFGYNDISTALLATELVGRETWRPGTTTWNPRFGWKLQQPRTIRRGAQHLVDAAERLTERSVFLSWKYRDLEGKRQQIQAVVDGFARAGFDCWWDHRALPASRALGKIQDDPELLGQVLRDGLARSSNLLALGSPHYGRPSLTDPTRNWTASEWQQVDRRFVWERWGRPIDGWPAGHHEPLPADIDEADVATELLARIPTP